MRQNNFRLTTAFILFVNFAIGQTGHGIQFGTFETHKGKAYDWWRLKINADSTFIFEDRTIINFDSTEKMAIGKGRWRCKGAYLILYTFEKSDSTNNYPWLLNTKWKFKKDKIYTDDLRGRVYFAKLK